MLCAAWAIGDGSVEVWFPAESCPTEITDHVKSKGAITGFGITFERLAWNRILGPRHNWPVPELAQFHDSAAAAAALSLPRTTEGAAKVLGLTLRRDEEGRRLHVLMSMRHDEPSESDLERLGRTAVNEVEIERDLHKELFPLSPGEREVWLLDQVINDRGIMMDIDLVASMLDCRGTPGNARPEVHYGDWQRSYLLHADSNTEEMARRRGRPGDGRRARHWSTQ